jgi:hypothetical protein
MLEERLILTDAAWQEISTILARVKHTAGSPPKQSDRMFLEAVLYGFCRKFCSGGHEETAAPDPNHVCSLPLKNGPESRVSRPVLDWITP